MKFVIVTIFQRYESLEEW